MGLLSMATCQDHYSPAPAPAPTAGHKSRIYVLTPPAGLLPYHGFGRNKIAVSRDESYSFSLYFL